MKQLSIITSTYNSSLYLGTYFKNIIGLIGFETFEIILILNQPQSEELKIANTYLQQYPNNIRIIKVDRESIGASINRGYKLATTEFITYADVDDFRNPDCYIRQVKTLKENPHVDFTYGDFVLVSEQGETHGEHIHTIEFNFLEATRSSIVGPNHFFRRTLLDRAGYWDEQLRSGGDFDFQVRAALNGEFKRTVGPPLLYYTRFEGSNSASSNSLQPIERTVIELRYGVYDKLDYRYLPEAVKFNISNLYWDNQWHSIDHFVPGYEQMMAKRRDKWFEKGLRQNSYRNFIGKLNAIKNKLSFK